jgi:hypothetical protein
MDMSEFEYLYRTKLQRKYSNFAGRLHKLLDLLTKSLRQ